MKKKLKKYDSVAARARLKKAAMEIFAKEGYKAATLRMISAKAKVNLAMVNRYFGGKDQLFQALLEDIFKQSCSSDLTYPAQSEPIEEIKMFLESVLEGIPRNLKFIRILVHQALIDKRHGSMFQDLLALNMKNSEFLNRLQALKDCGKISSRIDVHDLADSIREFNSGLVFLGFIFGERTRSEMRGSIDAFCRLIILE